MSSSDGQRPELVVLSTDRRNTYLGMRAWSEGNERKYRRVGFAAAQSAELWERWKKGEGLKSIGRDFGKPSSCIFAHIRPSGGIMPPVRRRSRLALTLAEREEISRGLVAGQQFARWLMLSAAHPRRSAGRLAAMAGPGATAPRLLTAAHGGRLCVRSRASWRRMITCGKLLRRSWRWTGRQSRSRAG